MSRALSSLSENLQGMEWAGNLTTFHGSFRPCRINCRILVMNYYSRKYDFPYSTKSYARGEKLQVVRHSLIALIGPIIILGGIATGIVAPTESGALGVAYVALAGAFVTKRLTWARIAEAVCETVRLTSSMFVMIGAAAVVGWLRNGRRTV